MLVINDRKKSLIENKCTNKIFFFFVLLLPYRKMLQMKRLTDVSDREFIGRQNRKIVLRQLDRWRQQNF